MLKENQVLAHFRIIRLLGEGGMRQVYLAEDQKLHRQVALKILTADYFNDTERRERFQREARTAAQISHGNVMAIYDVGNAVLPETNQSIEYIVMEYIKGKSLSDYLKGRAYDISTALRLAEKIASGLAAAHKIKVVHRDIKAENILIDEEEQPKILDFGLAKPVDPVQFGDAPVGTKTVSQELTKAGKILGTVTYMSPEQVRGEALDTRSDVFSFGVLLNRMLAGEFPFAGQTQVSTLAKILETRHEAPRVKNAEIPAELERIIDKCLQNTASLTGCAELKVRAGRYAEGKKLLEENAIGEKESTSGYDQPHRWYLLGLACEGLNDRAGAVKYYSEMLKYWGNPDTEVKEISDARA